jgi:hypothetical protein
MKRNEWQDWVNVVLGVWLVASPWVLGFADQRTAAVAAWAIGAAVVVFAVIGAYMREAWEKAITLILGVVLMGAPWILGFEDERTAMTNAVASAALVVIFAIWAMLRDMDIRKLKDEHRQAPGTR